MSSSFLFAQKGSLDAAFALAEDTLAVIGKEILQADDYEAKSRNNQILLDALSEILLAEQSMDYPFKRIENVSFQMSDDKRVRTITWMQPREDGTFRFHGFVQLRAHKKAPFQLIPLTDLSDDITKATTKVLKPDQWYGAIYYAIVTTRNKKDVHYTLLAYDANTPSVQKKILDYLKVNDKNEITFGAPVFQSEKKVLHRVFFQYAKDVSMSLRYDKKQNRIVFDHLVPQKPALEGLYEFYGPDFSYDAYLWDKGKWRFQADVDARNESLNEGNKTKKPQRKELFKP
jgi:hypothetical protein